MKIPFAKPSVGEDEIRSVTETIRSGWITQGPRVEEFEREFARYVGARYAVATSSCTTALHLVLNTAGVGVGVEVICPTHSFIATANAVRYCGAKPVFVDIDQESLNIDTELVKEAITPRTKVILAVHQAGRPANLQALSELAEAHGITLIEDAACAAGSTYRDMRIGGNNYSSGVCFSFHPRKILSTGDGGMITTDREDLAIAWRLLRQHGMSTNDYQRHKSQQVVSENYIVLGYNYRMTDIQASIGLPQLRRLDELIKERRYLAHVYNEALRDVNGIHVFKEPEDVLWNYQTYLIRLEHEADDLRNRLMQKLFDEGIPTRRGIMSIHREPCYQEEYGLQSFAKSERSSDQCICLPLYPGMHADEVRWVVERIKDAICKLKTTC